MGCEIWLDQSLQSHDWSMYNGFVVRAGQKLTIPNKTVCRVGFMLKKQNFPAGTLYCRIRKVSDDNIIETSSDTIDVSTLTAAMVWYYFT